MAGKEADVGQRASQQEIDSPLELKNGAKAQASPLAYASLANHKLFKGIPTHLIQPILSGCPIRHLKPGEALIRPGEENHQLYLLISGRLQVSLTTIDSDKTFPIEPGECIGEMSIIEGRLTSAYVVAETVSSVLVLAENLFWDEFVHLPGAVQNLLRVLSERMRKHNDVTIKTLEQQIRYEHLQKELEAAGQIQANILPKRTPLFPRHPQVDVHALMEAAREVGGDFFDAFVVDGPQICIMIGDVSGKGMPAALFMVRVMTLLRMSISKDHLFAEVLPLVNRMLCENNENCMFVTLFVGLFDVSTGKLTYMNAGHNPPFFARHAGPFELLAVPKAMVMGLFEEAGYGVAEITLQRGDTLLLYTDGITEAENARQEFFSTERALAVLERANREDMVELVGSLKEAVLQFCDGAPQSDDITMVALHYRGDTGSPLSTG